MNEKTSDFLRVSVRPWGLLTAAGAIACAATLLGFLGRVSWFLDLFSHFRVQYLVGLGISGILLLLGRRRKTAVIMFAFACINLGVVLPLYFGGKAASPGASLTLRAMLLNVNTRRGDPERVKQVIQEVDPDFVVLEEISSQWVNELQWLATSHPHSCLRPREDNFGIGLFSKLPLAEADIVYIGEAAVPSIIARVDTSDGPLIVIATHPLPPGGADYSRWRDDQLDKLPDHVPSSLPVLLLGDLNVTPWNHHFRRLLKRTGLRDSSQGRGVQPTWPSHNLLLAIPIDHCLYSQDISIVRKQVGDDVGSDHYPVIVDFAIKAKRNSKGPTHLGKCFG